MITPCTSCVYWVRVLSDHGECRRRAPYPLVGDGYVYASFPQTREDVGCGEGQARKEGLL